MTRSNPISRIAAFSLLLACDGPGNQTPEPTTPPVVAPPEPPPVAPPFVATPSTCTAPFIVPPPYKDSFVDDAGKYTAHDLGEWGSQSMRGPFAARDELHPGGCTDHQHTSAPPFTDIVRCITGDPKRPPGPDNQPEHLLLVRTTRGWWSHSLARTFWPHGGDEDPQLPHVTQVTAADRFGDGGAEVTAIAEVGPPGGSQTRSVIVCGVGPSGVPACTSVRVAAGGPFHGDGAMLYHLTLGCDATVTLQGWEGGSPVKLIHARAKLKFP